MILEIFKSNYHQSIEVTSMNRNIGGIFMIIFDVFSAVKEGTYKDFLNYFEGDVTIVNKSTKLNLLQTALVNDSNKEDKIKIINYLITNGIDINYVDTKFGRNALHFLYYCLRIVEPDYLLQITKILISNGVNINQTDCFNAIPMKYIISLNKSDTKDLKELFQYLFLNGADYKHKDKFDKSVMDYAKEFNWRTEFLDYVKEYENEN